MIIDISIGAISKLFIRPQYIINPHNIRPIFILYISYQFQHLAFNKEIIFKNQKSQSVATINHLQKYIFLRKTRVECQVVRTYSDVGTLPFRYTRAINAHVEGICHRYRQKKKNSEGIAPFVSLPVLPPTLCAASPCKRLQAPPRSQIPR